MLIHPGSSRPDRLSKFLRRLVTPTNLATSLKKALGRRGLSRTSQESATFKLRKALGYVDLDDEESEEVARLFVRWIATKVRRGQLGQSTWPWLRYIADGRTRAAFIDSALEWLARPKLV